MYGAGRKSANTWSETERATVWERDQKRVSTVRQTRQAVVPGFLGREARR